MEELLKSFEEAAQKVYEVHERRIIPIYPLVLVKMLPKIDKVGSIFTPGNQNTVMREGRVLETWRPFSRWQRKNVVEVALPEEGGPGTFEENFFIFYESELKPGDYVIFPHYEGMPVPYLNGVEKDEFRLVREINKADPKCAIQAKFEFKSPVADQLKEFMYGKGMSEQDRENLVSALLERFVIVSKGETSHTTSGV